MFSRLTVVKPRSVNGERVDAGTQVDDAVLTGAVGDGFTRFLDQRGARGLDRHARQHGARRVAHGAGQDACAKAVAGHSRTARIARHFAAVRIASSYVRFGMAVHPECSFAWRKPQNTVRSVKCQIYMAAGSSPGPIEIRPKSDFLDRVTMPGEMRIAGGASRPRCLSIMHSLAWRDIGWHVDLLAGSPDD